MTPPRLLRLAHLVLALGAPVPAIAQELPSAGLQLPPLPLTSFISASLRPAIDRPAGFPGGPPAIVASRHHLTLPEKPSPAALATLIATTPPVANPFEAAPTPPDLDLLSPDADANPNPLLPPGLTDPAGDLPLPGSDPAAPASDLLPSPDPSATTSGFMELHDLPAESPPAPLPAESPALPEPTDVPASDLSPAPAKSPDSAASNTRGPVFRIKGTEAYLHTRPLGYHFTPAQGQGRRDGIHTVASQVPNVLTSEVHGPRMMQMRPSPLWTTPYIENTFYMFCDANYNAIRLQPGWKIRGIQLKGPNWQWVACPKSGGATASFSIRVRAWKTVDTPAQGSVVTLEGLTLEGPPGATDWKAAFPSLLQAPAFSAKR